MDLVSTKILVAILFGLVRFLFGTLPVKLYRLLLRWEGQDESNHFINKKRHEQVTCVLALCQSFGGGVLFATCFLHMMPEVYKSVETLKNYGNFVTEYPLSQLTISLGFFLVYFVEELSHWCVAKVPDDIVCPEDRRTRTPSYVSNKIAPGTPFIIEDEVYKEKDALSQMDNYSINTEIIKENEKNQMDIDEELEQADQMQETVKKQVKTKQQIVRYVLVVLALSLHALFEGLAIGLQNSIVNIWYLFIAVSIHSATILFYISLELLLVKTQIRRIMVHVSVLSITSPLGVLMGLLITEKSDMNTQAKSTAVVLLEGLSAGTLLYITFFEVLNREKERRAFVMTRALCILSGFVLMALLQCYEIYVN